MSIFYRSSTKEEVSLDDYDYDSEQEADEAWRIEYNKQGIDSFKFNLCEETKQFMKLWNEFTFKNKPTTHSEIPQFCEHFVKSYPHQLKSLRPLLLLHLVKLNSFQMIKEKDVENCMQIIDET